MVVVVVQPPVELTSPLRLGGVAAGVGPPGAGEPLDLPNGLRAIRPDALVLDAQLRAGVSPQVRLVGAAIARQDPLNRDAARVEPLDRPDQHGGGGDGGFVIMDLGVGDTGVVIDDGMDVGLAYERVPPLVARLVRCVGAVLLALLLADVAPAPAVGDVAKLLHIDVQHGTGVVVLVAADGLPCRPVDVGEAVQLGVVQDPVDCRRRDPEPAGQLDWPLAQSEAELDAASCGLWAGLVRGAVGP